MELLSIRSLMMAAAGSLVLALGSAATGPEPLEAGDCGGPGEQVCQKDESCAWFIFYEHCTTRYDYYADGDGELPE